MFHFDRGLWITSIGLAVDIPRQQKLGFVSHAHGDHAARHELILCTTATGELLKARYGRIQYKAIDCADCIDWGDAKLEVFPAGHMLGSAMLKVHSGGGSLLYTGDFRLTPSLTAEKAAPPEADVLIMECTFGEPKYAFPSRAEAIATLVGIVKTIRRAGKIANVHAYAMGKAQELIKTLTEQGFNVAVDRTTAALCDAYQRLGIDLGDYSVRGDGNDEPDVIISPPRNQGGFRNPKRDCRTIAVTGWAMDSTLTKRWGVDYAVPISDHADYTELLQLVEMVRPRRVYCTHGTRTFAEDLRRRGIEATNLEPDANRRRK
jgi:putative mRNA 3-end processing factor